MAKTNCAVFEPTEAEFCNFRTYIEGIERNYPGLGICKIIPPATWFVQNYDISKMKFIVKHPLQQQAIGRNGMYSLKLVETPPKSIQKFYEYTQTTEFQHDDYHVRERKFWQGLSHSGIFDRGGPIYGADVEGTLFTNECTFPQWDLRKLDNHLNGIKPDIPGVSTPMLYVGSWCAQFAYHVEDLDLYSINYLHYGAAKSWYSVEPQHRKRLEALAQCYFRQEYEFECKEFLRHKNKMISPSRLKSEGIDFQTVVQHAGEFVVTFPGAYHAGFNHGFNIAEATNFALPRWFQIGRKAGICLCTPDTVRIDVDIVETRYLREIQRVKQQEQAEDYFSSDHDQSHRIRCLCPARRFFAPTEENPIIVDEAGRFMFYETFTSSKGNKEKTTRHELRCCQTCALWFHTECVEATFVEQESKFSCHVCQRIELEEAQYCSPAKGSRRSSKKMMLLTPPTTAAKAARVKLATVPKKKKQVTPAKSLASNLIDLTSPPPPPASASSSSSSSSSSGRSNNGTNNASSNVKLATATAVAAASGTVLEVGYRRNQLVRILLPRHAQATIGMLVSIEGQLGRLHVKGDPKANDIWVSLADCYVVDDPSTASAPRRIDNNSSEKKSTSKKRKPRVMSYEASMNKALRLSMLDSKSIDFTRTDASLYFDESEVYGDTSSSSASYMQFTPFIPAAVKMEVEDDDIFGYGISNSEYDHCPPLMTHAEDDDDQSLHSYSDTHDHDSPEMMVDAIPASINSSTTLALPATVTTAVMSHAISPIAFKEVIDLTASDHEEDDEEEEEDNHFYDSDGNRLVPARVADLLALR